MTEEARSRFYVAIAAEPDADDLVAHIVLDGDQIARATRQDGAWVLTLYDCAGPGERRVPLDGLISALQEAVERLG
jgi:hypothetical protein